MVPCRNLDVEEFHRLGHCQLAPENSPRPELYRYWGGEDNDRLFTGYQQVFWRVGWGEQALCVVHLAWETGCGGDSRDWVIADLRAWNSCLVDEAIPCRR
ncbi:MAG TPA: hypothetical protein VNQ76_18930 [Planctomicrobium sp.]|nr:hypothetical protein [Planctomicrobium sp.]